MESHCFLPVDVGDKGDPEVAHTDSSTWKSELYVCLLSLPCSHEGPMHDPWSIHNVLELCLFVISIVKKEY